MKLNIRDLDPSCVWFTSDHHFGHKSIIKHCDRPFEDVHSMDKEMMTRWNATIKPADTVFYLGDLSFHPRSKTRQIVESLTGNIVLIIGNHDKEPEGFYKGIFETVLFYAELKSTQEFGLGRITICHYPFRSWNLSNHGGWNIHGHCHGRNPLVQNQLDVSVDAHNFYPVNLLQVRELMDKKKTEVDEQK